MSRKNEAKNTAVEAAAATPDAASATLPTLGFWGWLRWAWTQLTTMRTAMFLLLLLAVAAVPGSLVPQRQQSPQAVAQYIVDNPFWGEVMDKLQLFDVFSSVWFSAIYLLLFISLIGCVTPRTKQHWQASTRPPARTPARFGRLPVHGIVELPAQTGETSSDAVADDAGVAAREDADLAKVEKLLRRRRYRVLLRAAEGRRGASVAAERGYSREWGNLGFHYSLVGLLISVAVGGLFGYSGQRILVEGEGFTNTLISYDQFTPGLRAKAEDLQPFQVSLDSFHIKFDTQNRNDGKFGQPIDFTANVKVKDAPGAQAKDETLKVNYPLRVGGTALYLVGNGYAPVITVKDGEGKTTFSGPVVAVPQDGNYMSLMVLKVPDAHPDQLGFQGFLLPTTQYDQQGVARSAFADALNPSLQLNSYYGDLGLDDGKPQNVYVLNTDKMKELNSRTLDAGGIVLAPNEGKKSYTLPDGKGSISFDGLKKYIGIEVRHDPAKVWVLAFASSSVLCLAISLFVPRRRVWVKFADAASGTDGGGRRIEYGLLARGEDPRLEAEGAALRDLLLKEFPGSTALDAETDGSARQRALRD